MSDIFWKAQEQTDQPEVSEIRYKRPLWVTLGAVVDLLLLFAVVPVGILSMIPFFFLIYIYLAQVLVWISPVLLLLNIAIFWWSFRRKQAATTALAGLGIAFVTVSFVVVALWQAQIVILGISF